MNIHTLFNFKLNSFKNMIIKLTLITNCLSKYNLYLTILINQVHY